MNWALCKMLILIYYFFKLLMKSYIYQSADEDFKIEKKFYVINEVFHFEISIVFHGVKVDISRNNFLHIFRLK